jgi:hypothetical protein
MAAKSNTPAAGFAAGIEGKGDTTMAEFTAVIEGKMLKISIPLQTPQVSASGKSKVVATTHGNVATTVTIDGKVVIVGVNAYIRA